MTFEAITLYMSVLNDEMHEYFQVINGLMNRKDWDRAIQFPIGCIPGGSGNALCCSVNYLAGYVHVNICSILGSFLF